MDVTKNLKDELEERLRRIEDFIENRGVGSSKLKKAKKIQKSVNLAIFLGTLITAAGMTFWAMNKFHD